MNRIFAAQVAGSGDMNRYRAPLWLPGGDVQTIWSALFATRNSRETPLRFARERWNTADGDFIDVDRLSNGNAVSASAQDQPLLLLFHGLEGSSSSHYAQAFAAVARSRDWQFAIPHFRGCSGEPNLAPRAYHSGDFEEVGWMLQRFRDAHRGPLIAVGVSLGGNALLRWAEEAGHSARQVVSAVAAVSAPVDLAASGHAIGRGFNRLTYTRMFLASMIPKALAKLEQHPALFNRARLLAARDLHAFDDVFTAPLHGFASADDYWSRASAKPRLGDIRIPALLLNALNDPFVPAASLPSLVAGRSPWERVSLWQPEQGGHVGFPLGPFPANVFEMPRQVLSWLASRIDGAGSMIA